MKYFMQPCCKRRESCGEFSQNLPYLVIEEQTSVYVYSQIFFLPFRPSTRTSSVVNLVAGTKYRILLTSAYNSGPNELKLGFSTSSLTQNPITKEYLNWKYQGNPVI